MKKNFKTDVSAYDKDVLYDYFMVVPAAYFKASLTVKGYLGLVVLGEA
jgi:hypothetical protein